MKAQKTFTFQEMWRRREKYPRCSLSDAALIDGIPFLVLATDEQLSKREAELEKSAADHTNGKPKTLTEDEQHREKEMQEIYQATQAAKSVIIERALAAGIGTPETLSRIIYDMSVPDFRELTEGFPKLSRVDFKPLQP